MATIRRGCSLAAPSTTIRRGLDPAFRLQARRRRRRRDKELVREAVRRAVRAAVEDAWGKRPAVKVLVTQLHR